MKTTQPKAIKQTLPKLTFLQGEDDGKCGSFKNQTKKNEFMFPLFHMGCCGQADAVICRLKKKCDKLDYEFFKEIAEMLKQTWYLDYDWYSFSKNILEPNREHLKMALKISDEAVDEFLLAGGVFLNNFDKQPSDEGEDDEEWEKMRLEGKVGYFPNFKNFLEHPNELEY
jgi:hypothetical protein